MPLTRRGKSVLRSLVSKHGEKEGKQRFYGGMNSGKIKRSAMEKGKHNG